MKLAKLSLATIVAVGAMTTFASATPLEEAIKGTELNGYVRYRFEDEDNRADKDQDKHRFTVVTDFTMPITENLKSGVMFTVDGTDHAENSPASDAGDGLTFELERAWFQYSIAGFSLKGGKIEILSPWTDPGYRGSIGDGALALYSGVPGWTFGAGAFVSTNLDPSVNGQNATGGVVAADALSKAGLNIGQEDLYALAAIGAVGPVNLQVWAASMNHVFDYSFYGDVQFAMAGFSIEAQANMLKLSDEVAPLFADDTGLYYGVKAGYEIAGFSVEAGYTKNDKDQPIYTLANDDSSGFIFFGEQLAALTVNTADAQVIFANLGYSIDKFKVEAGYGYATAYNGVQVANNDDFGQEWYVKTGYKYTKNFNLSAYYSSLDMEDDANDNDKIRFEAKYSF